MPTPRKDFSLISFKSQKYIPFLTFEELYSDGLDDFSSRDVPV